MSDLEILVALVLGGLLAAGVAAWLAWWLTLVVWRLLLVAVGQFVRVVAAAARQGWRGAVQP